MPLFALTLTLRRQAMNEVTWVGDISNCDICNRPIEGIFFDAKTRRGPWGILCPACFERYGIGVGHGAGQMYQRQGAGLEDKFVKVSG
jgi:hypothetical protein